jgi:hypothetical protein
MSFYIFYGDYSHLHGLLFSLVLDHDFPIEELGKISPYGVYNRNSSMGVDLIGSTKTPTGLEVICVRDDTEYELARKVSDEDFESISTDKINPFVAWNYKIPPR